MASRDLVTVSAGCAVPGQDGFRHSSDRDRDRGYDDDDYCSRNGKANGGSTPPPAYEEGVQRVAPNDDREERQGVAAAVARAQSCQVEATVSTVPETVTQPNEGGSYFASQAADDDFDDFDPRGVFSASESERLNRVWEASFAPGELQPWHHGASPETIRQLPVCVVMASDVFERCSICLEIPMQGDVIRRLACMHGFHKLCIDEWLECQPFCPICKTYL